MSTQMVSRTVNVTQTKPSFIDNCEQSCSVRWCDSSLKACEIREG
jgi:hypothetical protein